MNNETIIAELEAQGYQIVPPRDHQSEWEMKVGLLLQSYKLIESRFIGSDIKMPEQSKMSLSLIKSGITDILKIAEQDARQEAA